MLTVKTPAEAIAIAEAAFGGRAAGEEYVPLGAACGRVLSRNIEGTEYVPDFDRSTVDGYAVRASDTFGCSESIPAVLPVCGEVLMGFGAGTALPKGGCVYVPTGGAVPQGADAVVMIEYTENFGDGTVGILKSAAPGDNMIFRGDDVFPGKSILPAGRRLNSQDIGALAAVGAVNVPVRKKPVVGIISTGDELVPVEEAPGEGQVRNVNSAMLCAFAEECGCTYIDYGIITDDEALLGAALDRALGECDTVLISGGSSVGMKDASCRIIEARGELLLHGIAVKPGKPTILGNAGGKPVFGLPGHPVAAAFVSRILVKPVFDMLSGRKCVPQAVTAVLTETVSANHGRAQLNGARLFEKDGVLCAEPVRGKSGLITTLAASDGWFCIERDCEGVPCGSEIKVAVYSAEREEH